jgi:hypothetical protein
MPASDSTLYARPLIVFLVICSAILIGFNYVPVLMARSEMFADMSITYPALTCPADTAVVYTTQNILDPHSKSFLPLPTEIIRSADGTLTGEAVKAYIDRLRGAKLVPENVAVDAAPDVIAKFAAADEAALKAIRDEYCYIRSRYEYCVRRFIEGAYSAGSGSTVTNYDTWIDSARILVVRLLDILTLIVALKDDRATTYASKSAAAEAAAATAKISMLLSQKKDLNDPDSAKKLYSKMVEYTTEKNKANSNLIALYSGLNLVALGMLFYIYRAS